ncbi:hypothetical protein C8R45DRAFT_1080541 [Mycena sanguinolenta]|nr:hypothetical protein C8R45DRAFT_1080541 [Mycena sanguinolenta]
MGEITAAEKQRSRNSEGKSAGGLKERAPEGCAKSGRRSGDADTEVEIYTLATTSSGTLRILSHLAACSPHISRPPRLRCTPATSVYTPSGSNTVESYHHAISIHILGSRMARGNEAGLESGADTQGMRRGARGQTEKGREKEGTGRAGRVAGIKRTPPAPDQDEISADCGQFLASPPGEFLILPFYCEPLMRCRCRRFHIDVATRITRVYSGRLAVVDGTLLQLARRFMIILARLPKDATVRGGFHVISILPSPFDPVISPIHPHKDRPMPTVFRGLAKVKEAKLSIFSEAGVAEVEKAGQAG